jgi:hypothetical protein
LIRPARTSERPGAEHFEVLGRDAYLVRVREVGQIQVGHVTVRHEQQFGVDHERILQRDRNAGDSLVNRRLGQKHHHFRTDLHMHHRDAVVVERVDVRLHGKHRLGKLHRFRQILGDLKRALLLGSKQQTVRSNVVFFVEVQGAAAGLAKHDQIVDSWPGPRVPVEHRSVGHFEQHSTLRRGAQHGSQPKEAVSEHVQTGVRFVLGQSIEDECVHVRLFAHRRRTTLDKATNEMIQMESTGVNWRRTEQNVKVDVKFDVEVQLQSTVLYRLNVVAIQMEHQHSRSVRYERGHVIHRFLSLAPCLCEPSVNDRRFERKGELFNEVLNEHDSCGQNDSVRRDVEQSLSGAQEAD